MKHEYNRLLKKIIKIKQNHKKINGEKMGIVNDNSMFIKVETYKEALATIDKIKTKIEDSKKSLARVAELKKEEEVEMELWQRMTLDVEKRIKKIDETLVNAGHR